MVPVPRGATDISSKEVYQAQIEVLWCLHTWVC